VRTLDIGLDCDGVMYDFYQVLKDYLVEHRGLDPAGLPLPATSWGHHEAWGLNLQEFLTACNESVDAGVMFRHGEPYEGTVEAVNRLKDAGHRIHVITNRSFGSLSHHNTSDWLREHGIPFDSLIFAAKKGIVRPDIMLDDYEKNFFEMWDVDVETWLLDQPWNQETDTERVIHMTPSFSVVKNYRVFSWGDFEDRVEEKANA